MTSKAELNSNKPSITQLQQVSSGELITAEVENANNLLNLNAIILAYNWIVDNGADLSLANIYTVAQEFSAGIKTNSIESLTTNANIVINNGTGVIYKNSVAANNKITTVADVAALITTGSDLTDGDKGDITVSSTGAVWTINNNVITNAKMADNAVSTAEITDNAITTAKLASDAVTTVKVLNNAITTAKLGTIAGNTLLGNSTGSTANVSTITIPPSTGHIYSLNGQLHPRGTRTQAMYFSNNGYSGGELNDIVNTTTETSIFKGKSVIIDEPGETTWPTILANTIATGDTYRIKGYGALTSTATPTIRFRVKLGSTVVIDTLAVNLGGSSISGGLMVEAIISFDTSSGLATTQVMGNGGFSVANTSNGSVYGRMTAVTGATTVDMTANRVLDCTFEWNTASASNRVFVTNLTVERIV